MSDSESGSYYPTKEQYKCVRCKNVKFTSWNDYENHHTKHAVNYTIAGLPVPRLERLEKFPAAAKKKVTNKAASHPVPELFDCLSKENVSHASPTKEKSIEPVVTTHSSSDDHTTVPSVVWEEVEDHLTALMGSSNKETIQQQDVVSADLPLVSSARSTDDASTPCAQDPLSLNQRDSFSKATTNVDDTDDVDKIEPEGVPLTSSIGTIRVLPFESLMSPSVVQTENNRRYIPTVSCQNVMVAIPEQSLVDLNLQTDTAHSSKDTSVSIRSVSSESTKPSSHQSGNSEKDPSIEPPDAFSRKSKTAPKETPESSSPSIIERAGPPNSLVQQLLPSMNSRSFQVIPTNEQQQCGSYDHTYHKNKHNSNSIHNSSTHQRPSNYDHTCSKHQLNPNQRSLAGSEQSLPPISNSNQPMAATQTNFVAVSSTTTDLRSATIYTARARTSPTASQPVFPAPQNVIFANKTTGSIVPVYSGARSNTGNTFPALQQTGVNQLPTAPQPPLMNQNMNVHPSLVQMVRPQFRFEQRLQFSGCVQVPVQPFSNGLPHAQQVPRQQLRPSPFVVIRPQHSAIPTSTPLTNQITPRHLLVPPQALQTRAQYPVGSNTISITAQSRPQHPGVSTSTGIQSQTRAQRPHIPSSLSIPNQMRQMARTVRQSVRPDVPSGVAVRQSATVSVGVHQPSSSNLAMVNSMPSAQKRPLVVESGVHVAPTRPKLLRATVQSKTGECEVSVTLRPAAPTATTSSNVTTDQNCKSTPDQVNTVVSLMNNPHITLVPAKNKENASNSDVVGNQSGPHQEPAIVDLTDDVNPPPREPAWKNSLKCQVCNQTFNQSESLKSHLVSHLRQTLESNTRPLVTATVRPSVVPSKSKTVPVSLKSTNQGSAPKQDTLMVSNNSARPASGQSIQQIAGVRVVSSLISSPSISFPTVASNASSESVHINSAVVSLTRSGPNSVVASASTSKDCGKPKSSVPILSGPNDLVVPLVDLTKEGALRNLEDMGITQFIPVSSLTSRSDQQKFVIPIMSIASMGNPSSNVLSLPHLSGVFHLGPASSSEASNAAQ